MQSRHLKHLLLLGLFYLTTDCFAQQEKASHPNVLFICVDDLRPELGCYGKDYIKSPNIDRLASEAAVFTRHYVQIPTCGASRCSILTGMLPRTVQYLSNEACSEMIAGNSAKEGPETFIEHLKNNGYYTVGIGKISHYPDGRLYGYTKPVGSSLELPHSWNEMLFNSGKWGTGWNAFFGYADGSNRQSMHGQVKPYERGEVDDDGYPDGLTARLAIEKLKELKAKQQPFFLDIGFFKPHLPFNSPAKYWDLYDENTLPVSPNPFIPENVNRASLHNSSEFNSYRKGDEVASLKGPVSDQYARKLRHAYFACISYVDAQIGKVLQALHDLGLEDNTIVILWGDHGWHLGDQLVWGKHTIFERGLNSVLIIKMPGQSKGKRINKIVSSIDIYPSIVQLCGLKMPHATDGSSLLPLLKGSGHRWKNYAYSYFNRGISLRTANYRLTKYFRKQEPVIELYDEQKDPNETINIAGQKPEVVKALMPILEKGNTGLYNKDTE